MQYIVYWGSQRPGSGGGNHLAPALRVSYRVAWKRASWFAQEHTQAITM